MSNTNISQFIDELRDDVSKLFSESSSNSDDMPNTSSGSQGKRLIKSNKVHPKEAYSLDLDAYKSSTFININADNDIDEAVKKMRLELKETYDLLINARDTLVGINFGNLKCRIKDLHVYPTDAEIDQMLQNRPFADNLDELTCYMKDRFNEYPGEFGDIPELNSFLRTCTQLQRNLDNLTTQTRNFEDLESKIMKATQEEKNRVVLMKDYLNNTKCN